MLGNLGLIVVHRAGTESAFSRLRNYPNKALYVVSAIAILSLAILTYIPWCQVAFGFSGLSIQSWLIVLVSALLPLGWLEVLKLKSTP